ncbi:hypothetical protein [Sphingomonas sp. 28-62-11]|uniref:hypothetical protein n=1 Tax=Sphingomonas sp. 28-62-11 TaxID=1970432 RepID=UPI000BD6C2A4|nr:MAG: hypothetical protein B7Y49_13415 [Sphingomonas sp. 28-62-11]
MDRTRRKYRLEILGAFRLYAPDGERIEIASRRGQALIAMLALASGGERTRVWLQDRLWSSRQQPQAQASLRRELSNVRAILNCGGIPLLNADFNRVWLDLDQLDVSTQEAGYDHELLEGLDIPGEDSFEDWLRAQRRAQEAGVERDAAGQARLPARIVDMDAPVPGFANKTAIAVLPLQNMTGSVALDYLADGISEELIERLSRLRWLPVIARSASFLYRDPQIELRRIGQSLGVRYVLEGSLRRGADVARLGLRMADAETGLNIWSYTADLPLPFSQPVLDARIVEIIGVLDTRIDASEKARVSIAPTHDLGVEDLIWRGRWHLHRFTREDSLLAEACFNEALARVPNSAEALIQLTFFHARSIWTGRKNQAQMQALSRLAQRSIAADGEDGRAYMYAGMAELWQRRPGPALTLFYKAVALNPSLSLAHSQIGSTLILDDRPTEATAPLQLALRLGPNDEHTFLVLGELAIAHCMMGNWEHAIDHADQALLRRRAYWYAHVTKINALARQGLLTEARNAHRHLLEIKPDFSPELVDWLPFMDPRWNEFLKVGLRLATPEPNERIADQGR